MYGRIAMFDISNVWVVAGLALMIKGFLTMLVRPKADEPTVSSPMQRGATKYGEDWQDELGGLDDEKELGKFVGHLLSRGHYKWITRRSEIESLLERLLPELSVESKDIYDKQLRD